MNSLFSKRNYNIFFSSFENLSPFSLWILKVVEAVVIGVIKNFVYFIFVVDFNFFFFAVDMYDTNYLRLTELFFLYPSTWLIYEFEFVLENKVESL